jgi:FG-GAP-like repeat/Stigma-specific protein, Stig1
MTREWTRRANGRISPTGGRVETIRTIRRRKALPVSERSAGLAAAAFALGIWLLSANSMAQIVCGTSCCSGAQMCCAAQNLCAYTQEDSKNCGGCNAPCTAAQECISGVCTANKCPPGEKQCLVLGNNTCVDTDNDNQNCGNCNTPCSGANACIAGVCTPVCTGATNTNCGGTCVNTANDPSHCGTCANACAAGKICVSGACQDKCSAANFASCGGLCVNKQVDRLNCGACGTVCSTTQHCVAGSCASWSCRSISFATAVNTVVLKNKSAAFGDFDRDGKLDALVVLASSVSGELYTGKGDGTFNFGVAVTLSDATNTGNVFHAVAADLNRDGKLDVIAATNKSPGGYLTLTPGTGSTTFGASVDAGANQGFAGPVLADINNDGLLDFLSAGGWDGGTVPNPFTIELQNSPQGSPQTWGTPTFMDAYDVNQRIPVAIDLNYDGNLDFVSVEYVNGATPAHAAVWLGNGTGSPGAKTSYNVAGTNVRIAEPAVGDLNGDGYPDIVTSHFDYLNLDGGGIDVFLAQSGGGTFNADVVSMSLATATAVVVADFNGDGRLDVAEREWGSSKVSVFPGKGDGTFGTRQDFDFVDGADSSHELFVADFNNDGKPDLAALTTTGTAYHLTVLLNNTTPSVSGCP